MLFKSKLFLILCFLSLSFNAMGAESDIELELTLFDMLRGKLGCNLIACMLGALLGSIANICLRVQNGNLQIKEHPLTTILINIFLNMFIAFLIFLILNSELHLKIFSKQFDPLSQFIIVILTAFLGDKINDHLFDFIKEKYLDKLGLRSEKPKHHYIEENNDETNDEDK